MAHQAGRHASSDAVRARQDFRLSPTSFILATVAVDPGSVSKFL
jgi:hypothetical protein